jgi:hypothetical protein
LAYLDDLLAPPLTKPKTVPPLDAPFKEVMPDAPDDAFVSNTQFVVDVIMENPDANKLQEIANAVRNLAYRYPVRSLDPRESIYSEEFKLSNSSEQRQQALKAATEKAVEDARKLVGAVANLQVVETTEQVPTPVLVSFAEKRLSDDVNTQVNGPRAQSALDVEVSAKVIVKCSY